MIINSNVTPVTVGQIQKTTQKQESQEPKDSFQKSEPEEHLSYGKNLFQSTAFGAMKGFMKVGETVGKILPSGEVPIDDGQLASVFLGAAIGAPLGAIAGFAMGIIGKNIGNP